MACIPCPCVPCKRTNDITNRPRRGRVRILILQVDVYNTHTRFTSIYCVPVTNSNSQKGTYREGSVEFEVECSQFEYKEACKGVHIKYRAHAQTACTGVVLTLVSLLNTNAIRGSLAA